MKASTGITPLVEEDEKETDGVALFAGQLHEYEAHQKIIDLLIERQKGLRASIVALADEHPEATVRWWMRMEIGRRHSGTSFIEYPEGDDQAFLKALRGCAITCGLWTPEVIATQIVMR